MTNRFFQYIIAILILTTTSINAQVQLIFDTDIGADADDLGALAMLNNLQNNNECEILAVMSWSTEEYAVPAIDAINTYYGNPNIPIGVRKDSIKYIEWNYNYPIAKKFEHNSTYETATDAVTLYRSILSKSTDSSIVIVTVGPLKNIENLLNSGADSISPLTGTQLVHEKVKEFVIMGGKFPEGKNEWNFNGDMKGVTKNVLETIKSPITFSGFEVGWGIQTGKNLNEIDKNTPMYVGYRHFSEHAPWMKERYTEGEISDNASYDQTAVYYAVRSGIDSLWKRESNGVCVAEENGDNKWISGEKSNHSYLVLIKEYKEVAPVIEDIMLMDMRK